MAEKAQVPGPTAFAPYLDTVASLFHPVTGPVMNSTNRFHGWKESMGLVQPGTVENLTREISRGFINSEKDNTIIGMIRLIKT